MLNGLSYEEADGIGIVDLLGTVTLDTSEREPTLVALSIDGANGLFVIDSDTYVPIYATGAISYGPIQATQGWNIDGETYTLVKTSRSSTINSILETTPAWNGVLVGKKAPTVLYNLVPSEMTIQENNDGSRSYIKNIDGTIDNMLAGETYDITFEVNGETFTRTGKVIEANGMQILMNELGNGPIDVIGGTTDYIRYGHYLNIALENGVPIEGKNAPFIVTNGIYKDNTPTVKIISYTKQSQSSAPNLTPFAVGDRVTAGTKYVFDTTKEAELLALAQSLEGSYDEYGQYTLLYSDNLSRTIMAIGKPLVDTPTYILMVSNGDNPVLVWSSEELSGMGLTKGWQSNVVNGEYTISIDTGVVTTINNGDQWNGIIVGKA